MHNGHTYAEWSGRVPFPTDVPQGTKTSGVKPVLAHQIFPRGSDMRKSYRMESWSPQFKIYYLEIT